MGVYTYPIKRTRRVQKNKKAKLNVIIKRLTTVFIIVFILLIMRYAFTQRMAVPAKQSGYVYEPIVVTSGDTLWKLADKTGVDLDKRSIVAQIMNYNALASTTIYPGQVIYIPKIKSNSI